MLKFEVKILTREIIKPSSPETQQFKPFKICLFDQIIPTTYATTIIFYSVNGQTNSNSNSNSPMAMAMALMQQLKTSLSHTLNVLYPLSGRIKDNMFIHRFDEGVPFLSAGANCRLSEFLKHHEIESLNKFLPCQPFNKELNDDVPLLLCQVTTFACGGIAIGLAMSHKITDVQTAFNLANVWSKICRSGVTHHNVGLAEASMAFPPRNPVPQSYLSMMENLWFTEANYQTRRFVFDANALAKLKAMAKGEDKAITPSRIQALSGFIWKCFMEASMAISGTAKPSILVQAVSLRARDKTKSLENCGIGNLFWWGTSMNPPETGGGTALSELVELMRESVAAFDDDYLSSLQGEQGYEAIADFFNQLETMFSSEKPDIFGFTSWCNLGFYNINFGWGNPQWFALFGKVGSAFRNHTVYIETKGGKGIEAWITLDEKRMSVMEKHPEFLKFAAPTLNISSL